MQHYIQGKASVIIDGQFGSTGKGLIAAWVAEKLEEPSRWAVHTTNAAPNAGHTTKWKDGRSITLFHLPTGGVVRQQPCYLNAGSIIDIDLLAMEMQAVAELYGKRPVVSIHPCAGILTTDDVRSENEAAGAMTRIASTRKGVGSALARKIRREAKVALDHINEIESIGVNISSPVFCMNDGSIPVSIEVPQGVSLSLNNSKFYPFTTSREISVAQAFSDAFIHPSRLGHVIMAVRTFPIRVGNVEGGTSGSGYLDQSELGWDDFPVSHPELTTVTKRPRRIFTWSDDQYRHALLACRPDAVFLNFVNYYTRGSMLDERVAKMNYIERQLFGFDVPKIFGLGPNVEDVYDDMASAANRLDQIIKERS